MNRPIGGLTGYITPAVLGVRNSSERGGKSEMPIGGHSSYITFAVLGVRNSSERGGKCEVAHWWAEWLHDPCRLGGLQLLRAGRNIKSGPMVGPGAT